jgi:hypothetical protein
MNDRIPLYLEKPPPGLELILFPAHHRIVLGKNSKPKDTGQTVPAIVRISTFPGPVATADPARLRQLARQLQAAADTLERAHAGHYPLA